MSTALPTNMKDYLFILSGELERTLHENMDILMQKCNDLELEVHQLAERKFVQYFPFCTAAMANLNLNEIKNTIDQIDSKINSEIKDQLSSSTGEFQNLIRQLDESRVTSEGLEYLLSLFNQLESCTQYVNDRKYSEAVIALNQLDRFLKKPLCEQDDKIYILVAVKTELSNQRVIIEMELADSWAEYVKWNIPRDKDLSSGSDQSSSAEEISLSVASNKFDTAALRQLVEGLNMSNMLTFRMKTFSSQFQKYIVPFLTDPSGVVVELKSTGSTQTLSIKRSQPDCKSGKGMKGKAKEKLNVIPEHELYKSVFENLVIILTHLHDMLLHADFGWQENSTLTSKSDSSVIADDSAGGSLMGLLGLEISPWLLDFLQRDIIAKAVPTSAKDLEGFEHVITATTALQEKLVLLGLIGVENQALLESVDNVNLLFSNKKSVNILEEARNLMTADLLNETVAVTDSKPIGDWPMLSSSGSSSDKKGRKIESMANLLSDNTFKMPDCRISRNIQLLMSMVYETLLEASESSSDCAIQMFYAVHNIFELFCDVVKTHHGRNIETFPQMSALHHNNCMFVAHHLMTLGHQFALKLPLAGTPTFVDLFQKIRMSGVTLYRDQVVRQRDLILESLDGADGFSSIEEDANYNKAERAIKQALLQLQHLQKVWQAVLPVNVYRKTMGKLIESVVDRITDCISSLEDIAQEATKNLTALLVPLENEAANLMALTAPELIRHIHNWTRLTNTKTILNTGLLNIGDLWSEGKGPFALTFSPTEMKNMIRALFQNTDRRAAILATIK